MKNLLIASLLIASLSACSHATDYQDEITGEIVVDFADNVSTEYITELGKKLSIHFVPESDYSATDKVYIGAYYGSDEDAVINELRHDGHIEAADRDMIYTIPEHNLHNSVKPIFIANDNKEFPNDPMYDRQWNMKQINLKTAWNYSAGKGVIIAILDTGISHSVEDLDKTSFTNGYDFINNRKEVVDGHGHGTHCAGSAAQSTNNGKGVAGVAFRATLMPVKVLSDEGSGSTAPIIQGIHFAVEHGANVISMSLGNGNYSQSFARAIKLAHDQGVVVVCASGNSARGIVSYPAAYPGAIAVAATQPDEETTFYSNWGKETAIAAPGGNTRDFGETGGILQNTIVNGKEGYYSWNGTSMATPHVAGVAAMIIGEGIKNPDRVREILVATARIPNGMDGNSESFKAHYGAGILDADRAIDMARATGSNPIDHKILITIGLLLLFIIIVVVILASRTKKW